MDDVEKLISKVGGHVTRPCYRYLEEAVRCCLEMEEFPRGQLTKILYPMVAQRFGMKGRRAGKTVSRAVARAVADTWDCGDRGKLQAIAGGEWRGRPLYSISYWTGANGGAADSAEAVGIGIATALVAPHLICTGIAVVFNILGWAMSHRGFALTGGILYAVAMLLFPMYFMFVVAETVLSFVGFARLKKLNAAAPLTESVDPK